MNSIFANLKTTAAGVTPLLGGVFMLLAGVLGLFHISVPGVTITADPLILLTTGSAALSTGLGLIAAKDGTTHSTESQVEKASEKAVAASVAQSVTK
jgi:TPP-dependent indolepyruvate ferredoxin oxidoreductase alpha subunit